MFLYRLSYDPQRPNRLFISGQRKGGDIFSWAYAPGMNELVSLTNGGVPAYKCAFWDGVCCYDKRLKGFEARRIVRPGSLEYMHLEAKAHIVETIAYGTGTNAPEEFE